MTLTDEDLNGIYFDAVGEHLNEDRMEKCKAFIAYLFDALPAAAYVDAEGHVDTDSYLLNGAVRPLFKKPELEK